MYKCILVDVLPPSSTHTHTHKHTHTQTHTSTHTRPHACLHSVLFCFTSLRKSEQLQEYDLLL